jgi:uncharacterized membrane protein
VNEADRVRQTLIAVEGQFRMPESDTQAEGTSGAPALTQQDIAADIPVIDVPEPPVRPPVEDRMQRVISLALLFGVLASAALVVLGGVLYVSRHAMVTTDYAAFRGTPSELRTFRGVMAAAWHFSGKGMIQLGLMLLVGVQVVRVFLTGILFALERDRIFVGITGMVFVLLMFGIIKGILCCH